MKKLLIFLLTVILLFSVTACKTPDGEAPSADEISDGTYTYALYGGGTVYSISVSGENAEYREATHDIEWEEYSAFKQVRQYVYSGKVAKKENGVYTVTVTSGYKQLTFEGDEEEIAQYRESEEEYLGRLLDYGDLTREKYDEEIKYLNGEKLPMMKNGDELELIFSVSNAEKTLYITKYTGKSGGKSFDMVYSYRDDGSLESINSYMLGQLMDEEKFDEYNHELVDYEKYEYHPNGIMKKKTVFSESNSERPEQVTEYDVNGKRAKLTYYDETGYIEYIRYFDSGEETREEEYDENGRLISLTEYNENGHKVTQYHENGKKSCEYIVNGDGEVISEKEWDEEGNEIVNEKDDENGTYEEITDENGNVIGEKYYENGILRYETTFDKNGNAVSSVVYDENGEKEREEHYENGKLTRRIEFFDGVKGHEWLYENEQVIKVYRFDAKGNVVEETDMENGNPVYVVTYDNGVKTGSLRYEYSATGALIKRIEYDADGDEIYVIEFDENGNVITEEGDGPAAFEEKNVYSENGKLIGKDTYNYGVLVYEVRYDEAGNVIKEANYNSDGTTYWVREYYSDGSNKYWATYDESGRLKKETWYNTDGSWRWKSYYTNGNVEEEFHVEADGSTSAWWMYDENGNLTDKFPDGPTPTPPTYDAEGNLVTIIYYEDGVTKQSEIATANGKHVWAKMYYEDGTLSRELTYNSAGELLTDKAYAEDGTLEYDMVYGYAQLDPTKVITITKKDGNGKMMYSWTGGGGVETSAYFENGIVVKEESRYTNGHRFAVTNYENGVKTELIGYNKDNRMINKIVFYPDGDHKAIIEYDPSVSGRIIKQEDFAKNGTRTYLMEYENDGSKQEKSWNEDGTFKGHHKTEYDEKGHIKTTYEYYVNGVVKIECGYADYSVMKYIIWYDEEGNVLDREDY